MIFELLFWVANIFPNSKFGNSNNQTCKKIVSLPALKFLSHDLICFPLALFSTYWLKKKIKFLKHRKHRLLQSAAKPGLTYLLQLEESLLRMENGDYESSKAAGYSRGAQAVSLISSCFSRPLSSPGTKASHTDAPRREESAPCGLPALHGSQPAAQPAVRSPYLFSKPLLL